MPFSASTDRISVTQHLRDEAHLRLALLPLALRIGSKDNAGACVEERAPAVEECRAKPERELAVAVCAHPADGAGVPSAVVRLPLLDQLERRFTRRAEDGGGGL